MKRRHKPRSALEYCIYAAISLASLLAGNEIRLHYMDKHAEHALSRVQQFTPQSPLPAPRASVSQPSEADLQRKREIAEATAAQRAAEQRKREAWEQFYQPPRACLVPESEQRVAVCLANEQKQKAAFELAWAQGGLQ